MKQIDVVAAVIEKNGKFFVAKRPEGKQLGGLWEFPGGKVENRETHTEALRREIREEFDADITVDSLIAKTENILEDRKIIIHFYKAYLKGEDLIPLEHDAVAWLDCIELDKIALAPADKKIISYL